MRALRFDRFGPPNQLQIQEMERPHSQRGEVVVQLHAAGVNPSDVKNGAGGMEDTTLPRTPGRDFAGVVSEGPAELVGTEVWGTGGDIGFTRDGSHAEYLLLPREAACPKPASLSFIEAGSIGLTYVTAWLAIIDGARLQTGETLLVVGATGGFGSAAIQIGKWKGAHVIGTVRRESSRSVAQQNGADVVIDLSGRRTAAAGPKRCRRQRRRRDYGHGWRTDLRGMSCVVGPQKPARRNQFAGRGAARVF